MTEDQSTAEYRDIPGFPGYRVGNDGSVWSCLVRHHQKGRRGPIVRLGETWRRLKVGSTSAGYKVASLSRDGKVSGRLVHRLVLEAFVGPCPPDMECRHFPDRDPTNNHLSNLQWGTKQENAQDQVTHGTARAGENSPVSLLTVAKVLWLVEARKTGWTIRSIAEELGVTEACVGAVSRGWTWSHVTGIPKRLRAKILRDVAAKVTKNGSGSVVPD